MSQNSDTAAASADHSASGSSWSEDMIGQALAARRTRIIETRPHYPGYMVPIAGVTVILLAGMMAFAARLLDAIGNPISATQLSALSAWTWGLSGVALALLVWCWIVLPRASRIGHSLWRAGPALLLTAIICGETAYLVGPEMIDHLDSSTTATERQCAVQLRALAAAKEGGSAQPTPNGIATLLLAAPLAGVNCGGIPAVSSDGLSMALRAIASRRLGTPDQAYNGVFIPSVRSLRDAYNEYVAAQLQLVAAIDGIPRHQSEAWQRYLERLKQAGQSPARIPRRDWPKIAADLHEMGVPVPTDWNPADRTTFMTVLAAALRHAADTAYNDVVTQTLTQPLPPGLTWEAFHSEPVIQARWRAMIDAPTTASLSPDMGFPAFKEIVYEPRLNRTILPRLNDLLSPAENFEPRGRLGAAGRAGMSWALVPTALLYITLSFIIVLAGQVALLGCRILIPSISTSIRSAIGLCTVCIVILALTWLPLQRAVALEPTEHMPILWAVGSRLRNTVFAKFEFGYDPALAGAQIQERSIPLVPSDTTP